MQTTISISTNALTGKDLQIGDVVKQLPINHNEAFSELTVVNIDREKNLITFFRPFVHLGNFLYTGGVLHYTGTSNFDVFIDGPMNYIRVTNIYRGHD